MKIGVNSPCPCGSGKKYKKCCLRNPLRLENPRDNIKPFIIKQYLSLFALCEELLGVANKMIDREYKASEDKVVLGAFYIGKAYKTVKGILLLCREGYGEDAAILTRTLFDMDVNFLYKLKDKTGKRIQRYFEYDWYQRAHIYTEYGATKEEIVSEIEARQQKSEPHKNTIEEVLSEAKRVKKEYGFTNRGWSDKDLRQMSDEVGRLQAYKSVFKLQSNFTHTGPRAVNEYVKYQEGGYLVEVGPRDNWVEQDLVACFDFFYQMLTSYNDIVKAGMEKELDSIAKRYLKEMETKS